jgi:tetratricopeptide (TPR) repeat protein
MKLWQGLVGLFPVFMLGACSAPPVRERPPAPPPPTVERPEAPVERPSEARVAPYREPRPAPPRPVFGPAVRSLLETAEAQQKAGNLQGAASTLERALRIEPRNAHLWNRLARLRMAQDRLGEAADLAAKSNALAGPDQALKQDNWELIAAARRAAGDMAGARAAEHKAQGLR